ncbi:T9SS type A sorting domain-containing protein [uncultured Marixanthomonas sp.]|uniref:T9SS type A sorting domain-containing protein n=1 Tax=uncultured Marixanthomonas sp. TaxID=757245 RepID=UPI0030DD05A1
MKTKLFFIALIGLFCLTAQAQTFQKQVQRNSDIYHDLNLDIIEDGTTDFIVASNIFDTGMNNSEISLKRMDENGNIVWAKQYSDSSLQNARVFDVANMFDTVVITGSIDVAGTKRTFIAKIEAATGNVLNVKYFDIVSPNFNSTGLNIAYTNTDATGNGTSDPGFVVGGFFSGCYDLDYLCNLNIGYVLRVDDSLNVLWTTEVDTSVNSNSDYDFINKITETSDGFFLTGSATGLTQLGFERQGALAYLIDYEGNTVWNSSYIFGNSRDVSVDAYYEPTTGNIYMLSNYSSMHNFGITVFDPNGTIINSLSWVINSGDLDRYGFTLKESINSSNNLVVFGYDRNENWANAAGVNQIGQSNVIVYEFEKATGNQISINYQYLTPHIEMPGDEYNFWNGQMPLIYYPDMATVLNNNQGSPGDYLTTGYRTPTGTQVTFAEITKTSDKLNMCHNRELTLPHTSIAVTNISVSSGSVSTVDGPMNVTGSNYTYNLNDCGTTMGTEDNINNKTGGLYPNPATDQLTVYLGQDSIKSFMVHSVLGQQVASKNLKGSNKKTTLDVSALKTGIYFITVANSINQSQTFKFIKD